MGGWGGGEGSEAWMDGVRSEEGEIVSHGGTRSRRQLHRRAVNHAEGASFRERKAERRGEGRGRRPHPSRSQSRSSRELLENEELHGPDQITLQDK